MSFINKYFNLFNLSAVKKAEEKIVISEHKFRSLIEHTADAITILSARGEPFFISPAFTKVLGYTEEDIVNKDFYMISHREDLPYIKSVIQQTLNSPGVPIKVVPVRIRHKDGSFKWIDATLTNMLHDPSINGIIDNFRDVTENKIAEEKLLYANRLYGFISQINQATLHVKDEEALFREACRIAVEKGGFEFAWIGLTDNPSREIALSASWGTTDLDEQFFSDYTYDLDGPIANVVQGQEYYVVAEIQKRANEKFIAYANQRGFKSAICLALKKSGRTIGTFNMYSKEKQFFNKEEIALLQEATTDLSFALDLFEKERLRTLTQKKLKHSELRLSQAQAIAHLGSWDINFATGVSFWSDEMLRIHGLDLKDHMQSFKSWLSFIHPDDVANVMEIIREAEVTADTTSFYHRIISMDGSIRHILSQAQYEFNSNGEAIGLNGTALDVTDTKIAEEAMIQSQKNLRIIVDSIPISIFAKDYNGKYVFVNKCFASLHNITPKELVNKTMEETLPDRNAMNLLLECDKEIIQSGVTKIIPEFHFTDYNGKEHIFHVTKMPYMTAGKNIKSVLCIWIDITEQKYLDLERSRIINDIIQRNKDLEQFSYIVSHNLRAPVANIIGLTHELNNVDHEPEIKEVLTEELSSSVKRIDTIIVDLNSILRVREVSETSENVNLWELTDSIKSSIQHLIRQENVHIVTDFTEVAEIIAIKSYLYSIFYNLIYNSIKYRQPEVSPVIEISTQKTATKTIIIFKDNGLGMDLSRTGGQVFGLYKRFHPHIEGKGMGLFMVKTQVETLGGKISIKSKINEGTCFYIEFET